MERDYLPVLDFWFREVAPAQWFSGGAALDEKVRERFGALVEPARSGAYDAWAETPRGRLALILVLDQFSRHVFRSQAAAYAADAKARQLSIAGIAAGMDESLSFAERQFFYMPLMHAEDPELQAASVARFGALRDEALRVFAFAEQHRSIVERFGRFPHRNAALGRSSTVEERAFLDSGENTLA